MKKKPPYDLEMVLRKDGTICVKVRLTEDEIVSAEKLLVRLLEPANIERDRVDPSANNKAK
jgi:hypothetical protein